jgi:hypothetical protein
MTNVTESDIGSALNALVLAAERLGITDARTYEILSGDEEAGETWRLVMRTEVGGYKDTPFRTELGYTLELAYQTLTTITRTIDDVRRIKGL